MKLRFFQLAEKLAIKSNHPDHKHGAVLVRKGKIIGIGFNQSKTHAQSNHPFRTIHAEFSAIINSQLQEFDNCEMYIVRKRKNGTLANSKPCYFCERMLKSLSVKRVYYSTNDSFVKEQY